MANLYLCVSQIENNTPYRFGMTGIKVYTFEEALYHYLHHWRQSMEDFLCAPFVEWVEEIGLHNIAIKMRGLEAMENFSMAYLSFLSMTDYLPKEALKALQKELTAWEKRQAWEKFKEQGDFWLTRGDGERAFSFYDKALEYNENVILLNNAGLALLYMGDNALAAGYFEKAVELDGDNIQLQFNHIEALILAELYDDALEIIGQIEQKHSELLYFKGEISYNQKNYFEAIKHFSEAVEVAYDVNYIYRLSDCYMKTRQFEKALETLEMVAEAERGLEFSKKLAGHQALSGNLPAAIKSIEKALMVDRSVAELWIVLAEYYRMDYNLIRAQGAISKALSLSPENPNAMLEQARIRKAEGRTKDYQSILRRILDKFKDTYRTSVT